MSQITIQCRLVAPPKTRQQIWTLMAERNTPLINALIEQVSRHEKFETWRRQGKISSAEVSKLCQKLKERTEFSGQPSRLYTSAEHAADYIFKSWLAIQKQLQQRLDGKLRWLEMLKSDEELTQESGVELTTIRDRASAILARLQSPTDSNEANQNQDSRGGKRRKKPASSDRSLASQLFKRYRDSKRVLDQCAIAFLLKSGCKVPQQEEDPEKFAQHRRKVEIQIQRLQEQIESRIPRGRDLTGQSWLDTLETATRTVPKNNAEAKRWQDRLLTKPSSLPFPLIFETNEDLVFGKNSNGRLYVHFNGLSDYTFAIYCDKRQLHWFQRFFEDQEAKKASKNQHSSGLFTLRSARLTWQEGEDKGNPWDIHRLTLYCTIDTRLWTAEGTEQVRQEKATEVAKKINHMESKGDLPKTQEAYVKRLNSTLTRINTPFDRPSRALYQGQPHIVVGLSLGLEKPATVAVWNAETNQVLVQYGIRQLLGKDYKLLRRRRTEQQRTAHQRHKAQKREAPKQLGESELGQYVDRLLAKSILAIAKTYKAGSIAVPKLGDIRGIVEAEIRTRAEQKCPGYLEGQQRYAKQYRASIHRWSYARLIDSIRSQAVKIGIAIEEAKQPLTGQLEEKAKAVAIAAYQART
jgi:transposase